MENPPCIALRIMYRRASMPQHHGVPPVIAVGCVKTIRMTSSWLAPYQPLLASGTYCRFSHSSTVSAAMSSVHCKPVLYRA